MRWCKSFTTAAQRQPVLGFLAQFCTARSAVCAALWMGPGRLLLAQCPWSFAEGPERISNIGTLGYMPQTQSELH